MTALCLAVSPYATPMAAGLAAVDTESVSERSWPSTKRGITSVGSGSQQVDNRLRYNERVLARLFSSHQELEDVTVRPNQTKGVTRIDDGASSWNTHKLARVRVKGCATADSRSTFS